MEETVGHKLRETREAKELTLDQISKELHIRVQYLKALEENEPDSIPSSVQARGFLRSYSSYLGLSPKDLPDPLPIIGQIPTSEKIRELNIQRRDSQSRASSTLLFEEIGTLLKARRDVLGLSREDIEAHTHIPTHYVSFIENGEFDRFPSPAQARGMLSNYLSFLDLPSNEILLKYADALQQELSARQAIREADEGTEKKRQPGIKISLPKMPKWLRTILSPDLLLVSSLGILVIFITIWGIGRVTRAQSELSPLPTAPSLVEALLPTSTTIPSPTATLEVLNVSELIDVDEDQQESTTIPTVQVAEPSSVQLFIVVRQRAFLRVVVDGEQVFDGRVLPNDNLTFSGEESVELLTGNAAAIQVIYNDQDLGILGILGEVISIVFTREGVIRPTAAPTATPPIRGTDTLTPTPTPEQGPNLPPPQTTPLP